MKRWLTILVAGMQLALPGRLQAAKVGLIRIEGAIGPATAEYIGRAAGESADMGAECLVVELDTPGGLLTSTKQIVQSFYSARVPVVVFVTPAGATATSAGCFITLAADVAAMAPDTSIGAAHPVSIGGGGQEKMDDTMKEKVENFAVSYIETIAQKRGRNVEWAKESVSKSASITAAKAQELKVIDLIARDLPDLLSQLEGRTAGGRTLKTASAEVVSIPMSMRERLFQTLWHPEVMFILMLIAVYGLIGELSSPGAIVPGVTGAVALILALYMSAVLPVNFAGLALMILAIVLFVVDVFATTHGVLTAGGLIAFMLGSFMLFDPAEPALQLSWKLVLPATVLTGLFFAGIAAAGLRAQFLPVKSGTGTMLGQTVPAVTDIDPEAGTVMIEGELWSARSDTTITAGQPVEVTGITGLILTVKPKYDIS